MSFKGGGSVAAVPPSGKFVYQSRAKLVLLLNYKQKVITRRCVVFKLVTAIHGRDMEPSQYVDTECLTSSRVTNHL